MKIVSRIGRALLPVVLVFAFWAGQSWGQSNLTLGHQVLLEKGLQLRTLAFPTYVNNAGGSFNVDLLQASGFNNVDLGSHSALYDSYIAQDMLPGGSAAMNFSRWVYSPGADVSSVGYLSNLIGIQLSDEQSIVSSQLPGIAAAVATLKAKYPNAMICTNQSALYHSDPTGTYNVPLTSSILNEYMQTVQPDMLSFTEYPFRFQGMGGSHDYLGGSPTEMYKHIELYRKAGLAGLDGTGSQPIPVGMYVQTFAHVKAYVNGRQPTESEFRLQQFAGWAAGMKSVDAFLYVNIPTELDSMFFEGADYASQTPTSQFYQYAELNRQSTNLGDSLVRLISTDFRMKMGSHGTGTGVTNTLPSGVSAFNTMTDPYLTSISATNLGTLNNGLSGDVLYGSYKPIDSSLVRVGEENDHYFMIVNGLSDATGMAFDCRQQIHLDFDFSTSCINSLLRLSRETGQVEVVPLVHNGGSLYSLDLTLDGGTGDLFKYNTGSAFIGRNTEVVYRETFPSDSSANTPLNTVGWKLNYDATGEEFDGSSVGPNSGYWRVCSAAAPGLPVNVPGVNSSPHNTDEEMGHVVFAKSVSNAPGHNVLVWTDEVLAIDIEKADLAQVSWYEANNDATEMRLAVKIADDWYVTDTGYIADTKAAMMMYTGSKEIVSDFSSANWNPLSFISGEEMSRIDSLVFLPEGVIQAIGLYTDDMASDASRHGFDTFEIQTFVTESLILGDANSDGSDVMLPQYGGVTVATAVPEPSVVSGLFFLGLASLVGIARRRA